MGILSEQIEGTKITVQIESSNLSEAIYDSSNKNLKVTFKSGNIYEYDDVPWDTFTKFRMAKSQGSYFSKNIAREFEYRKLQ
jgi:hypothetical protein